jgi:hypothetical protein
VKIILFKTKMMGFKRYVGVGDTNGGIGEIFLKAKSSIGKTCRSPMVGNKFSPLDYKGL